MGLGAVLRYHERSTHHPHRFAPGPGHLDWANQPEPFRTYAGAARVELPLAGDDLSAVVEGSPPAGRGRAAAARPGVARGLLRAGARPHRVERARRRAVGAARQPLERQPPPDRGLPARRRGRRHPRRRPPLPEPRPRPRAAVGARPPTATLARLLPGGAFLLGLASIHWRESWKYGERAFRYCQHDVGHALGAVRYAAAVLGWSARLLDAPGDDDVSALLGLDRESDFAAGARGPRAPGRSRDRGAVRRDRRDGRADRARPRPSCARRCAEGRGPEGPTPSARSTWSGRRSPTWRAPP